MEFQNIIFEISERVAWIIINRPNVLNSLNIATLDEIAKSIDEIEKDRNVVTVVITGFGEKAFAAGADLEEIASLGLKEAMDYSRRGQKIFQRIENLGKPVIAAINGIALGGDSN